MLNTSGEGGSLVHAGRTLARLGKWQLESEAGAATISADVVYRDAYYLQRHDSGVAHLNFGKTVFLYAVTYTLVGDSLRMTGERIRG